MELQSIHIFEFDLRAGYHEIASSCPKDANQLPMEVFNGILPNEFQENNPISSINIGDKTILTHFDTIESKIYPRNAYHLMVAIVLTPKLTGFSINAYERVIRGITWRLKKAEAEAQFLSNRRNDSTVKDLLLSIHTQLSKDGLCYCPVMKEIGLFMNLKLEEELESPREETIDIDMVFCVDKQKCTDNEGEMERLLRDLTIKRVLQSIDGSRTINEISNYAKADLLLVKRAAIELLLHGFIVTKQNLENN